MASGACEQRATVATTPEAPARAAVEGGAGAVVTLFTTVTAAAFWDLAPPITRAARAHVRVVECAPPPPNAPTRPPRLPVANADAHVRAAKRWAKLAWRGEAQRREGRRELDPGVCDSDLDTAFATGSRKFRRWTQGGVPATPHWTGREVDELRRQCELGGRLVAVGGKSAAAAHAKVRRIRAAATPAPPGPPPPPPPGPPPPCPPPPPVEAEEEVEAEEVEAEVEAVEAEVEAEAEEAEAEAEAEEEE